MLPIIAVVAAMESIRYISGVPLVVDVNHLRVRYSM
jgi:hypothetical protein